MPWIENCLKKKSLKDEKSEAQLQITENTNMKTANQMQS